MPFTVKFYPGSEKKTKSQSQRVMDGKLDLQTDIPDGLDVELIAQKSPFGITLHKIVISSIGAGIQSYDVDITYKDRKGAIRKGNGQMPVVGGRAELVTFIPEASDHHYVLLYCKPQTK